MSDHEPSTISNAMSIDVEEYFHALVFREGLGDAGWRSLPSRVEESMDRVLALLDRHGAKATCFVLGEVAENHPALVRRIAEAGHEIACHGYGHDAVFELSPDAFRDDIRRAKTILEDLSGTEVIGYRAPSYSIGRDQEWAFDVLLEEGFRYDSSVYPIHHDLYGRPEAPRFPYVIRDEGERKLVEIPIGTLRVLGVNLPIGGGGYFRLLPEPLTRMAIRRVNEREGRPVIFYFHPWELDPEQPCPRMSWYHRTRHRIGMARQEAKLDALLRNHSFTTASETLRSVRAL